MWRCFLLSTTVFLPNALDSGRSAQQTPTASARLASPKLQAIWSWSKEDANARLAEIRAEGGMTMISKRQLAQAAAPMSFVGESSVPLRTDQALHAFLGGLNIKVPKEIIPQKGIYDAFPGFTVSVEELTVSKIDAEHIRSNLQGGSRLSVQFEGVKATVAGQIGWTGFSYRGENIKFTAELIETSFNFTVNVDRDEDAEYPHNVWVNGCLLEPNFKWETFECSYVPNFMSAKKLVTKIIKVALVHMACPLVEDYVSTQAKAALDMAIQEIQKEYVPPRSTDDKYVDLRAVPLLHFVDEFVKHDLGVEGLNSITKILYASFSKSKYRDMPLNISHELMHPLTEEIVADIHLSISRINMTGYDKVRDLRMPNLADSRDTVSVGTLVKIPSFKTTFKVFLRIEPSESFGSAPVEAVSNIEAEVLDIEYMVQIAVMLLKSHLPSWSKQTALCPECLLPAVRNISFADFSTRFTLKSFQISPIGKEEGSLEHDIDMLVNNGATLIGTEFRVFTQELVSRIAITRVADIINDQVRTILSKVQHLFLSTRQLNELKVGKVPHLEERCKDQGASLAEQHARNVFYVAVGTTAAVLFLVWQVWMPIVQDRSVASGSPEVLPCQCLAGEPQVPRLLVLTFPFLIFATMCLQTWANCIDTGIVGSSLERFNTKIVFPPVHELSAVKNVKLMLEARCYVLAVFTFWTCSIFPFIKLLGLMFAWLAPTNVLSVWCRGYLIGGINAFGKWSFMDFFIMAFLMAALHVDVTVGASTVILKVRALEAFFYYLYVAVVTQWFSHLCFEYHQQGVEREAVEIAERGNSQEAAMAEEGDIGSTEQAQRKLRIRYSYVRVPRFIRNSLKKRLHLRKEYVLNFVPVLLIFALVCFLIGLSLDVISVEHHGVAGELVNERKRGYSVMTLGHYIPHLNSADPNGVFIRSFQVLFLLLVVGAEGTSLVVLLVAYFVPIHGTFRHSFTAFARTVQAWAALDVFAVGLIGFNYYIPSIQETLKGDKLDIPNYILEEYLPDIGDEPVVFRMDAVLLPGAWLLLISSFVSRPVTILCRWAMHDVSVDTTPAAPPDAPSRTSSVSIPSDGSAHAGQTELKQCDFQNAEICD